MMLFIQNAGPLFIFLFSLASMLNVRVLSMYGLFAVSVEGYTCWRFLSSSRIAYRGLFRCDSSVLRRSSEA